MTSMAHGKPSLGTTVLCTVALETQETISTSIQYKALYPTLNRLKYNNV